MLPVPGAPAVADTEDMDREGAETYLRVLAETVLRGSLTAAAEPGPPGTSRMMVVGHALTAVGALDPDVTEAILADFWLAVSMRQRHSELGQPLTAAQWLSQGRAALPRKPRPGAPPTAPPETAPPETHHSSRGRPGMTPIRNGLAGSSRSG